MLIFSGFDYLELDVNMRTGRAHRSVFAISCFFLVASAVAANQPRAIADPGVDTRPNILWITFEDSNPHLGCYGDPIAITPRLDSLAKESTLYTRAFAYTGVCAPSRSCLITGVYPLRLGTHHMRSSVKLSETVRCFPEYLREAGYYCTNNRKEDYNFDTPEGVWDESSPNAHYKNRAHGQPFFAVFNMTVTHQSQIFVDEEGYMKNTQRLTPEQRQDPARIVVPPIHPDIPEVRRDWARHYENVTAMDYEVGDLLDELRDAGLADDTIVFLYSDHGTGMPAIKSLAWHVAIQVPLLIRIPERWESWAPTAAGSRTDRLVSFVDFAPTVLSLAGIEPPSYMQGFAFLGPNQRQQRTYVFGGKDRQAEADDTIRYVHDGQFHYLRNFQPQVPYGQYMTYNWRLESMQAWDRLYQTGTLSGPTARHLEPRKPLEELYDIENDPWEIHNLADHSDYQNVLSRLRSELEHQMVSSGDLGLLSEAEMHRRAGDRTPYEIALDQQLNPIGKLLNAAAIANRMDPATILQLMDLMSADDSAVRRWGVVGLVTLGRDAKPAEEALRRALADESTEVRILAAEALAKIGQLELALPVLREAMKNSSVWIRLAALQTASRLDKACMPLIGDIEHAGMQDMQHKFAAEYLGRMVEDLPRRLRTLP